jgi:hypothetical protein
VKFLGRVYEAWRRVGDMVDLYSQELLSMTKRLEWNPPEQAPSNIQREGAGWRMEVRTVAKMKTRQNSSKS